MADSESSNSFNNSQILDIDDKFDDDEDVITNEEQSKIKEDNKNDVKVKSPKAMPLVIFEDGKFIIPEQAKKLLSQKANENIGIISLVGKYRTGKSFLLNRVILNRQQNSGFDVGPTFKPCTKGIWIWSEPLMISNIHCPKPFPCFLIDTEGLGAYDEEINHDSKIFLIAVLISSLFIFNSFGAIDEMAINSLSFVLNLSKTIKIKSVNKEDNEEELAEYFPTLLWLLRDFSLKLEDKDGNVITEKQYLEQALENISGTSDIVEEKNRVRNLIKAYFPEKDCFVMVRPVEKESDLQNLQNLPDYRLRKEFVEQAKIFRNKVMKKIKPKTFRKKVLSGYMLIELIQSILDSINGGSIPVIENSWKYVLQNECIKNSKEVINKFVAEINKYRQENKNKKDFFKNVKKYTKKLAQNYIGEFVKNSMLDDDNKKEFIEKLENKLNNEINKFDKENEKFLEEIFNQELNKLANEFISNFSNGNDLYAKNYYQFFTDFESFKEKANMITPDFPNKTDILFDKVLLIVKKFIDEEMNKIKTKAEKEINNLKNENEKYNQKIKDLTNELNINKEKNTNNLNKLNNDIINERLKHKNVEEKMKNLLNSKKLDQENYFKQIEQLKNNYEIKIKDLLMAKTQLETDLKFNNEELIVLKMNNDKMNSLNNQKLIYLDKEINNWKEKYNNLIKDYKNKEDNLNNEISSLKEQIKKLQNEKNKKDNINTEQFNTNINNLMNIFKENLKAQNEENKSMFEKMMKEKQKNTENDNELFKNYNELIEKHSELKIEYNIKDNKIKNLEEEITSLNSYKDICLNCKALQCNQCEKLYVYDKFKDHYTKCNEIPINNIKNKSNKDININANNENKKNVFVINPEKLKIKILKGTLKNDELGKPYLEYIIDVNYNTQNWRINKRFNQFANLYKTIKSLFKGTIRMPSSSNIFVNFGGNFNGSFHENKIQQLEKFIKDLAEIEMVSSSKVFKKFLEFDQNFDEENDMYLLNLNQQKINAQNLIIENDIFNNKQFLDDISDNSNGYNNRYNFISNNYNNYNNFINDDILKFNDLSENKNNNNYEDYDD